MLKQLKTKFVAVIMVIATAMLCLVFGLVYHFTRTGLERESVSMLQAIASRPFQPGRPDEPPDQVRLPFFTLQIGMDGSITAGGGGYYDLSDRAFLRELVEACAETQEQVGIIEEYDLRFFRTNMMEGRRLVFADISSERATLRGLVRTCTFIGVLCFALFLGVSLLLASWAVKPVERSWEQQRQFVADASHELKTPLAVIMTNAELLQRPDWGEEDRARSSANILTMSRQMRSLVERLLELARSDSGQSAAAFEAVDLSAVVEDALLPFEPLFFERGLELSAEVEAEISVQGSAEQLRQVVDVLLDNAQKYSAPGGRVDVRLRRTGKRQCRLSVSDPGEPLSNAECRDIFKRFYRRDKARCRDGSFGLGLSIAQSITAQHHGRIWAESEGGINTFQAEFPTRP